MKGMVDMNMMKNGGNMYERYYVDNKNVDETTYKKAKKVDETTKKEIFMGNIYVAHRGVTKEYLEYKEQCIQDCQKKIDMLLERAEKHNVDGYHRYRQQIYLRLMVGGEVIDEKKINRNEYVLTVLFNGSLYSIGLKTDYQRDLVQFVKKIEK